jgi:hypothetical protein
MATSTQTLATSIVLFLVALWPLLTIQLGRPTSWFGNFLLALCGSISVFAPASWCLLIFIDILRRRADAAAFVVAHAMVIDGGQTV